MKSSNTFLIKSKVTTPNINESNEERVELIENILSFTKKNNIIYIVSPAGFGKTSLLLALSKKYTNSTWFSVDKNDNSIKNFINYLVLSINNIDSEISEKITTILNLSIDISCKYILHELFQEISKSNKYFSLFIDDFHHIINEEILDLIKFSLEYIPNNLKIFIASRIDNIGFDRELLYGKAVHIVNDITFSKNEIILLAKNKNLNISNELLEKIFRKTKGWIIGINLVLNKNINNIDFNNFTENISSLNNYFLNEIFNKLTIQEKDFLLATSVVSSFNEEIANYILEIENSNKIIENLIRNNLFIESFEDNKCFKYHDLFSEFLLNYLKKSNFEMYLNICLKLSMWFEKQNNISEAINFSHKSKDRKRTLTLIEKEINTILNTTFSFKYLTNIILEYKIEDLLEKPIVMIYFAWYKYAEEKKYAESEDLICKLEDRYTSFNDKINAHIYALKSCIYKWRKKYQEAEFFAKFAIKADPESILVNTYSNLIIASLYVDDDVENKALDATNRGLAINTDFKVIMLFSQFKRDLLMKQLNYKEAENECFKALEKYKENNTEKYHGILRVYVTLLLIYYDKNELDKFKFFSKEGFKILNKNSYLKSDLLFLDSKVIFLIAYCYSCIGLSYNLKKVSEFIPEIETDIFEFKNTSLIESFIILEFDYFMSKNLLDEIKSLIKVKNLDKSTDSLPILYVRYLLKINNLSEVNAILNEFLFGEKKHQNQRYYVQALIFQAVVYAKNNCIDDSIFILKQALRKTQDEELISIYTEIDDDLILLNPFKLLLDEIKSKAKKNKICYNYIEKIISLFEHKVSIPEKNVYQKEDILKKFTTREKEVFKILTTDLSNKEIASQLYISENTLKTHIKNIYKLLGISNRNQVKILTKINNII